MDGLALIDKPAGLTSHDVVARVRRAFPRGTKVGHAGTLDPFATGLLLVLVGRATRAQRFVMALPKTYETVARLGWTSSTGDPEGELVYTGRVPPDPPDLPVGELRQRPPAYSAVKVGGQRAYRLARAGATVELAERTVRVHRFEQRWRDTQSPAGTGTGGNRAAFEIECSAGTYVRSLVADLGDAYCLELRRTRIGPFRIEDATPPPERDAGRPPPLLDLAAALAFLPAVWLAGDDARRAGHGVSIAEPPGAAPDGDHVLLLDAAGAIAIAERRADGVLKPVVGFRG